MYLCLCMCEREYKNAEYESQSISFHNLQCSNIASLCFLEISLNLSRAPSLLYYEILNFACYLDFSPH